MRSLCDVEGENGLLFHLINKARRLAYISTDRKAKHHRSFEVVQHCIHSQGPFQISITVVPDENHCTLESSVIGSIGSNSSGSDRAWRGQLQELEG